MAQNPVIFPWVLGGFMVDLQVVNIFTNQLQAWFGSGAASSTVEQVCAPDLFSGATFFF